jgi:hypothetical protein
MKIKKADRDHIESFDLKFIHEFEINILKVECLFLSDLSSLFEFPESIMVYLNRIKKYYGVSIKNDKKLLLIDIFKKIQEKK